MTETKSEVVAVAEHAVQDGATSDACESAAIVANSVGTPEAVLERRRGVRLTAERVIFLEWLALTDVERRERGLCASQRELAQQIGVSESTLSHWRSEPDFQRDLSRRLRARCQEKAPAIIDKMAEKALAGEGDVPAARTILERAMPDEKPGTFVTVPVTVSTAVLVGQADEDAPLPEWYKEQQRQQGTACDELPVD